jgi:predicted RNA-binding Zn-ribbon protein involved in translation (DUF1610 family)
MSMAVASRPGAATPMASVMTVKCACPGEGQQVDLDAVGITLHCPECGGVVIAGFKTLPQAIQFLTALAREAGVAA